MKSKIAFLIFIVGTFGVVGNIECGEKPIVSGIIFLIGLILMIGEITKREEINDYTRPADINRPWFLH